MNMHRANPVGSRTIWDLSPTFRWWPEGRQFNNKERENHAMTFTTGFKAGAVKRQSSGKRVGGPRFQPCFCHQVAECPLNKAHRPCANSFLSQGPVLQRGRPASLPLLELSAVSISFPAGSNSVFWASSLQVSFSGVCLFFPQLGVPGQQQAHCWSSVKTGRINI